jgi:hypothetical protein
METAQQEEAQACGCQLVVGGLLAAWPTCHLPILGANWQCMYLLTMERMRMTRGNSHPPPPLLLFILAVLLLLPFPLPLPTNAPPFLEDQRPSTHLAMGIHSAMPVGHENPTVNKNVRGSARLISLACSFPFDAATDGANLPPARRAAVNVTSL